MFFVFLSLIIFGIIVFFTSIIFYRGVGRKRDDQRPKDSVREPETEREDFYIPVLRSEHRIPGVGSNEAVHYLGPCVFFSLKSGTDLEQLSFEAQELESEMEGKVALTSKNILVFNEENQKRIYISSIEDYRFMDPYLVIKRKNVKTKKDVLKLEEERVKFKYILHALK
ncbi:MAG: hypothetical protein JXQ30_05675 [Spirochaetes bacterium]|nr:hypothetical protein [Spirochaetota bacterium]